MEKFLTLAALPLALLTGSFALTGCAHPPPPPYYAPPPPPPPPAIARQGYDNGYTAGRNDIARGLPPDVNRHPRFRTPPMPPGQPSHVYRVNFRRGYQAAYGR